MIPNRLAAVIAASAIGLSLLAGCQTAAPKATGTQSSENAVQVLEELKQKEGETYEDYIRRLRRSYVSKQVIEAELEDRLDLTTYKEITDEDLEKIQQYKWAYDELFPLPIKKKTI